MVSLVLLHDIHILMFLLLYYLTEGNGFCLKC